jgi:Tol biopolymer transport system component
MGEVYRARDTRLDRTVAIKVLPSHLSSDSALKQRFEREAHAISSLQHSHICTLHDVGSQNGVDFLVMEYLEGETLADRLSRGPLKIGEVLKISTEIADALEKAHKQGIVHRDLKPGNIMLTRSGAKLLDFGLAKPTAAIAAGSAGNTAPNTPTVSVAALTSPASPLTQKGSVVGTFQYMAPEVLQGAEADARSDIFSFGCVLYEMIAGHPAFEGKTQVSVLAAILEKDPEPVASLQPLTPPALEFCIRTCLAKEPDARSQTVHDVSLQLQFAMQTAAVLPAPSGMRRVPQVVLAAGAALLLMMTAALAYFAMPRSQTLPVLRTSIVAPPGALFDATGDFSAPPAISPDGKTLVFGLQSGNGGRKLYVRSLDQEDVRPLEGTEGATFPFWSPDSRSIAFFDGGKLKKMPVDGGPATELAVAPNGRGGSWGSRNIIIFAPDFRSGLMQVSADGGTATPVTTVDSSLHSTHRWPVFLPDRKHFLFFANNHSGGIAEKNGIYFGMLGNASVHEVVATDAGALYRSGYLLFHMGNRMVAQPMDPESGKLSGNALQVVAGITTDIAVWRMLATASDTGLMVYGSGGGTGGTIDLTWYDRSGESLGTIDRGVFREPRLSPDGRELAVAEFVDNQNQIYSFDVARGVKTRITFDNAAHIAPAWSPDGKTIAYSAISGNAQVGWTIFAKTVQGASSPKLIVPYTPGSQKNNGVPEWVPGSNYLLYHAATGPAGQKIMAAPLVGNSKPFTVIAPQSPHGNIRNYRVSPDGKWIAFECDDGGQPDIYVSSFPSNGTRTQITSGGGLYPVWQHNGKDLYYLDPHTLMITEVPVTATGAEFQFGTPKPLFRVQTAATGSFVYDVTHDGKKFVITSAPPLANVPLTLMTNWPGQLKQK